MVSCGSKTAKGGDNDSTAVADSTVTTAPAELWTEEAVEAQIRKILPASTGSATMLRDGETKQYFAFSIQKDGTQKKLKEWQSK